MKSKLISFLILLIFVIFIAGCEYDNYDPPKSSLTGTVTYNGNAVGVRSGGTQLELWQYGFATKQKIPVYIDQDGTYTARLFDGDYKIVRLSGAPWLNQTDTISVTVKGATTLDVPVTPYFVIANETFSYSSTTGVISSSCNVSKIGTLAIENLTLYVGTTTIVDANNSSQTTVLAAAALTDLTTPKPITVTLNAANKARTYVYVRIGVKTAGIGERLYTPVQKLMLN